MNGATLSPNTATCCANSTFRPAGNSELTAVEKEITRTGTALDRYPTAFENNTLDSALLQDRLAALRAKTTQLQARRDDLTDLLGRAPAMPSDDELDALADHIDDILMRGTLAQRKAVIEQLIEAIQIVGPSRIRPIYRIPRRDRPPSQHPTTADRVVPDPPTAGMLARPRPVPSHRSSGWTDAASPAHEHAMRPEVVAGSACSRACLDQHAVSVSRAASLG
jgi:hypothetical protein